jgi:predicted outer membrane repeat protein
MMKRILLLFAFLAFINLLQAQIYVDASASGNNDGTSWADAYTQLSDAIANANEGDEIWVAAGEYLPGGLGAYRDTSFYTNKNVSLYGGFTGTETSIDERADYKMNPTILTGDVEDNDMPGDFNSGRDDNCKHVMFIDTNVTNDMVIDGFFIQNGHTDGADASGDDRRAGGMLSYGAPIVQNCTFTQNYGYFAAAAYPRASNASGIRIINCEFINNQGQFGGAMYIVSINSGLFMDCTFERNTALGHGGAIYNQVSLDTFINCNFIENAAGTESRGGAILNRESISYFEGCTFSNNEAITSSGGAIQFNLIGVDGLCQGLIRNCSFTANAARWGGSIASYEANTNVLIENCTFTRNDAVTSGASLSVGFAASVSVDSCLFEMNSSDAFAGAIFLQNDSSNLLLTNSTLRSNTSSNSGGAILSSSGVQVDIRDCVFESNTAGTEEDAFGGAISISEDSFDLATLNIERSQFIGNVASVQGGAISVVDVNSNITNCLFAFNRSDLRAGTISNNGSGTVVAPGSPMLLLNNTFALNEGDLAASVVAWEGDGGMASVSMQNNIFYNPGFEELAVEEGDPEFISLGGNLSMNANAATYLDANEDIVGADPLFVEPGLLDFQLLPGSPCIDAGVNDGAPSVDIRGDERDDMVDIGCYEGPPTSTDQSLSTDFELLAFPSITKDRVTVQTNFEEVIGEAVLNVYNLNGHLIDQKQVQLFGHDQVNLSLVDRPAGIYFIRLITNKGIGGATVIRQ